MLMICLAGLPAQARELRVCADPNNLPFSNMQEQGFENRIMEIVAEELGAELSYIWWAQRRGYVGNALNTGLCDIIPGIAKVEGLLLTYPPYYRSSYAFVTRADIPPIRGFDDPRLRDLQVGIQLIGDDGANTPPAMALARRGITDNVHGYSVLGDYGRPDPPARIIEAVADGKLDVAIAWGPMSGFFAARQDVPLVVAPVEEVSDFSHLPMAFDIFMGLRRDDPELRQEIETALARREADIDAVLASYHVPRLDVDDRQEQAR